MKKKKKTKLKGYCTSLDGRVWNSKIERKEKKRKSFGAKPERITPHMPLREGGHVVVNQKTSMKVFFGCHKSLLVLLK
jgi:hypothetical protein